MEFAGPGQQQTRPAIAHHHQLHSPPPSVVPSASASAPPPNAAICLRPNRATMSVKFEKETVVTDVAAATVGKGKDDLLKSSRDAIAKGANGYLAVIGPPPPDAARTRR